MSVHQFRSKHGDASDGALGGRLMRIDGEAKIRGEATYALENHPENLCHVVLVGSTKASGRVTKIDTAAAKAAPGVLLVLTPDNQLELNSASTWLGTPGPDGPYRALVRDVAFVGQHIAAVAAETFEQATAAAALLAIDYEEAPAIYGLDDPNAGHGIELPPRSIEWGEAAKAFEAAPVKIEATYTTPREYHTTIEPHGIVARWTGDELTIWEPSQWINGMARTYAEWYGIPYDKVRMISPFIGGGFGSKALVLAYGAIATMVAKLLDRPVKLAMTRPQTFALIGGRAATRQTLKLGATPEGKLTSIVQSGANETSVDGMWVEPLSVVTSIMYATPNFSSRQNAVPVNSVTPGALRAPGENPSAFGIECAIDELAFELGIDPVEIRLINYAEEDQEAHKPWSTRPLREAYAKAGEVFGWAKRSPAPRSMRDGRQLIGWGVAAGTYPVRRTAGEALVRILADGSVEVLSSGIDMGQGTYTILAQTAAEALGVPISQVAVRLGDSELPGAPVAGGSQLANLLTGAVHKAALSARDELIGLAINDPASPFRNLQANTLSIENGEIASPRGDGPRLSIAALLRQLGRDKIESLRDTLAENGLKPEDHFRNFSTISTMRAPTDGDYSMHSWCVHFVEVRVDEDFGTVRVSRMVSALDSGRLYNPRLAESQWKGGIIMGIGMALLEEGLIDPRHARIINDNLGDYLIATNADVPDLQVISVGVPDTHASVLGGKGVGELGIVGVAPAIANAVFHATGKRVRDLPITLEKLI
ncbi:xanthine dehydrogenase family protein molybdopterin-binding subunit [Starkeya sp. ORNL1]|uniref:xanthine dehydrogenase family protein molybdopterin-binding subunit n=1 Tax=Starkeya sp. ORNL1 TaxID=2709380 RepID=UPI00146482A0|nr:xanthine dehydrogenase family protein molybdopterin-binding subunit [Starkeya sp. ORNL1]QJP16935.1 xanthine dehydrogenase family protein molybdopterin-binding subunit [Starkeya sp. ORNL1]